MVTLAIPTSARHRRQARPRGGARCGPCGV